MRDPCHMEQVERWARFVRDNPEKWKDVQGEFIDAQIFGAWKFYERLAKTEEGREKIRKLKEMRMNR